MHYYGDTIVDIAQPVLKRTLISCQVVHQCNMFCVKFIDIILAHVYGAVSVRGVQINPQQNSYFFKFQL